MGKLGDGGGADLFFGEAGANFFDGGITLGDLLLEVGDCLLGFFPEGSVFAGFGQFLGFGFLLGLCQLIELVLEGVAGFLVFAALAD